MHNSIDKEIELFSILQKRFSKKDSIRLYYYLIPNGLSNKLNRFYLDTSSLWFSRLVVNNDEILYYFGLMDDEKLGQKNKIFPRVIFKFSENINNSSIHLIKDNVALLIKKPKNKLTFKKLKELKSKLTYVNKEEYPDLFYLNLGKINSKIFFSNLKEFIKTFNFEVDFNSNKLIILDVLKDGDKDLISHSKKKNKSNYYLNRLKFNLKAIEIKNYIENTKLSFLDKNNLNKYIFKENIDGDFYFDDEFMNSFDKKEYELLEVLKLNINSLSGESDYDIFLKSLINSINSGKSLISSDNGKSEKKDSGSPDNFKFIYSENNEFIEYEFKFKLNLDLINEILSKISIDSSPFKIKSNELEDNLKINLTAELKAKTSDMMFKFKTKLFTDDERELIVNKIEKDINDNMIQGEINLIIDYYLDQYKENKNMILGFRFLEGYIKSSSFKELINEYNYDETIVNDIIRKVMDDISINKLEYGDIETKFKIYFRSFKSNKKYYDLLETYKSDSKIYSIQYNLTTDELNVIFDKIEHIIDENNGSLDIQRIFIKEIENLVLNCKTEACDYVNNISTVELMNDLKLSEENCEKIKKVILKLVYDENLRKSQINKEYFLELRDKMVDEGLI